MLKQTNKISAQECLDNNPWKWSHVDIFMANDTDTQNNHIRGQTIWWNLYNNILCPSLDEQHQNPTPQWSISDKRTIGGDR